jgi:hypothetical protein
MRGILFPLVTLVSTVAACAAPEPKLVGSPEALPLALDDSFRVVKVFSQTVDPDKNGKVNLVALKAEIDRRYYGAINSFERRQREGNYYTIQWKAPKSADLTVRLEYRQQKLGSHVQAMDARYQASGGTMSTEFSILGDDYYQDGPVVAWRVLLIERGRIVGVQQSFLW